MKICVLQLARFGDILQTLPTLDSLKAENPGCEITLVVRERFVDAARLSSSIDNLIAIPTKSIVSEIIEDPNFISYERSLEALAKFVSEVRIQGPFDRVVNLTFSSVSSWLASLLPAQDYRGVYRANDGAFQIDDLWSQYFFAEVLQKNINILHLNDLFSFIAGCSKAAWPIALPKEKSIPNMPEKITTRLRIGVQCNASQPKKAPSREAWRTILKSVENAIDAEFIFFGSADEREGINAVIEEAQLIQAWNMAGTCAFSENIHMLRTCDVVITPDTAMVHFASIVSAEKRLNGEMLSIVYIPMGGVRAEETGPYGEGHHILYASQGTIQEFARACVECIMSGVVKTRIPHSTTRLQMRTNGSAINVCVPENFDHDENTNFFEKSYYLLSEFRCEGRLEEISVPRVGGANQPKSLDDFLKHHEILLKLKKAADFGSHFCFEMLQKTDQEEDLKAISANLSDTDALIEQLSQTDWLVKPLVDWWKVSKASVMDDGMEALVTKTEGTYRILSQNVDIVLQLMETAVKATQERLKSASQPQQPKAKESEL